jgi:UDP-3-O-[3-hydroxymyristoyl] glucosamine N-acyltransferase
MLIANNKPIKVIGFSNSTVTNEICSVLICDYNRKFEIISPTEFLDEANKDNFQYIIAFNLDGALRKIIIDIINLQNLDCITIIHPTVLLGNYPVPPIVGKGSFIHFNSSIGYGAIIGEHCIIEQYCMISHQCNISNNVYIHSGTLIAGKTNIGDNCVFNFKSTVLNALDICSNIKVGAVSTITKNIEQSGIYVGSPARRIGNFDPFEEFNNA